MGNKGEEKYALAAKITAKMVAEELAEVNAWTINDALSKLSKTIIFERILDINTKLWMDNPRDITKMVMIELQGEEIPLNYFYK